jgi:hypothetical protein
MDSGTSWVERMNGGRMGMVDSRWSDIECVRSMLPVKCLLWLRRQENTRMKRLVLDQQSRIVLAGLFWYRWHEIPIVPIIRSMSTIKALILT